LDIPSTTVLRDLKNLKKEGFELDDNSKKYFENSKWLKKSSIKISKNHKNNRSRRRGRKKTTK
jgi:hypothetical protein